MKVVKLVVNLRVREEDEERQVDQVLMVYLDRLEKRVIQVKQEDKDQREIR